MQNTFYWHDYETWGADPSRDRPAQFAGLRTDWDLNIIGDPLVVYSQPARDMLPHPQACLITGITPQLAFQRGVPESQFIQQIHHELVQPGTCAAGYNSLRFDDEVTRYTLYRNFFDPYAREWQNGNSRWDIIDMVRLCYALRPEGIEWPRHEDGKPSFRLEDLTVANGISHEAAHDALSDVHATIALARLIKSRQPKLYDYVLNNRNKHQLSQQLNIARKKPLLHVSSKFSSEHGCCALVMPLAMHPTNKNGVLVYDLSVDPQALIELDSETIATRVFTAQADLPDGVARIALKTIHINRCPVIAPVTMLDAETAKRLKIDTAVCRKHYDQLRQVGGLADKIQQAFAKANLPAITDPDRMLYSGGFASERDRMTMAQLRSVVQQLSQAQAQAQAQPQAQPQPQQLSQQSFLFEDDRFNALLFRFRGRNFPATLNAQEREEWDAFCYQRLTGETADSGITMDLYQQLIEQLLSEVKEPRQQQVLLQLQDWGDQLLC